MMASALFDDLEELFPLLSGLEWSTLVTLVQGAFLVWLILEIAFWCVIEFIVSPQLQRVRKPFLVDHCPLTFFRRILDTIDSLGSHYPIENYIAGFCNQARMEDISLGNFTSFLSWAMFGKRFPDLNAEEAQHMDTLLDEVHRRYPCVRAMPAGYNDAVEHCAFTLEPVPYIHRPLALYILAGFNEVVWNTLVLRTSGFRSMRCGAVHYWIKHGAVEDSQPPLLVFHGISPGWSLYLLLVKVLGEGRTVLLVDFDPIKIKSLNFFCPSIETYTDTVRDILLRHGIRKASVVGHSFGSITGGWFVRRYADMVCHLTLIDPVSLLLQFPEVAFAFLYRHPQSVIDWLIYLSAAREITISYSLRRHFNWQKNALYLEDIPSHIGVVLGVATNDEITCAETVIEYAKLCDQKRRDTPERGESASITCQVWKGNSHGQILLSYNDLQDFKQIMNKSEALYAKKLL